MQSPLRAAIATFRTLSPDGGVIPCPSLQLVAIMECVFSYLHVVPILTFYRFLNAFIAFYTDSDGNITREGLMHEKEDQVRKMHGQ